MKRKEKNKTINKNLIILIVVVLMFTVVLILTSNKTNTPLPASQLDTSVDSGDHTRIYRSEDLRFSVNVPSKFEIEERFTTILLKYNDELIQINRSGTNFNTLDAHLDNLSKLNNFTFSNRENIVIDNYTVVKGVINGEMHYFIYTDSWVYSFSTSSKSLFDDLDKIAQSFRYTP